MGRRLTLREAAIDAIAAEMDRDESVVVIGQDVGEFGGPLRATEGLRERFGSERVIETPIAEPGMVGLGIGMAMNGLRPVVDVMFADFLPLTANELMSQAANLCYMTDGAARCPLVVRTRGGDGPYRAHPQNLEALFSHVPGLTVVVASSPADARGLLLSAIRSDDPVLFIEPIFLYQGPREDIPDDAPAVPLSTARVVRHGDDVTVVAYGRTVPVALAAAGTLEEEGVGCEVVDLRTVAPMDVDAVVTSTEKTRRLVVAHDAWVTGGIGAEVVARVAGRVVLSAPSRRIGAPDIPIPYAPPLRDAIRPDPEDVVAAARATLNPHGATGGQP